MLFSLFIFLMCFFIPFVIWHLGRNEYYRMLSESEAKIKSLEKTIERLQIVESQYATLKDSVKLTKGLSYGLEDIVEGAEFWWPMKIEKRLIARKNDKYASMIILKQDEMGRPVDLSLSDSGWLTREALLKYMQSNGYAAAVIKQEVKPKHKGKN